MLTQTVYRPFFKAMGRRTRLYPPTGLANTEYVSIGRGVTIRSGVRLEVVLHGQDWVPSVEIHDKVNIEQNVHIVCHGRIVIETGVLITGGCAIVDVTHPHLADYGAGTVASAIDPAFSETVIGANSFVGFGATILPNVKIGRNCYIGTRSVVTRDLPDGSVVAGVPAKIIGTLNSRPSTVSEA
jgi:acetyltransferase-like isoleucine patch superfamily enzyme